MQVDENEKNGDIGKNNNKDEKLQMWQKIGYFFSGDLWNGLYKCHKSFEKFQQLYKIIKLSKHHPLSLSVFVSM